MSDLTHLPKTVKGPDGKPRVVYTRTSETDQEMEKFRMGPLADIPTLGRSQAPELYRCLRVPALVIQAPYLMARQAIRTRLGVDRSSHRVLNGMTLFQHHFFASESCREGFPQFKQLFLSFGYIEITNRLTHQVINEILFTRYELGLHFWLLVPKSLGELAAQWGDAFMNFQVFPSITLTSSEETHFSPLSVACPTAPPGSGKKFRSGVVVRDSSVPEGETAEGSEDVTRGDIKFQPKERKWNRGVL